MNQTKSINISGVFFVINDDAYLTLSAYISALEKKYQHTEDGKEIVQDIESRIAELFTKKMNNTRTIVEIDDVNFAIQTLGKPEEFENFDNEEMNNNENADKTNEPNQENISEKRLYRNEDDKVIMGVCSGLSAYFGINDPIWLRLITLGLAFIVPGLSTGTVFLAYIILGVLVPKAKTTSQKLQMRGQAVNLNNIEKKISGAFDNKNTNIIGRFFNGLGNLLNTIFSNIAPIISTIVKIIALIFALIFLFFIGSLIFSFLITIPVLSQIQIFSGIHNYIAGMSLFLLIAIPALFVIIGLASWLLKSKINKNIWWVLSAIFVLSAFTSIYYLSKAFLGFSVENNTSNSYTLNNVNKDTLYIATLGNQYKNNNFKINFFKVKLNSGNILQNENSLDVERSNTDNYILKTYITARGENEKDAKGNLKGIEPNYYISNDTLYINPNFEIHKNLPWRFQQMKYTLQVPEGKAIHFTESSKNIINDVKNVTNTLDKYMIGKTWSMQPNGLTCIACNLPSHTSLNDDDESFDTQSNYTNQLNVTDFNKIKVQGAFSIEIEKSDEYNVQYSMDKKWENIVNMHSEGNELIISMDDKEKSVLNKKDIANIKIKMPKLKRIISEGINNIEIDDFVDSEDLEVQINGASNIDIKGSYNDLILQSKGASRIKLKGSCQTGDIETNGATIINADKMKIDKLNISLNGAGKADVWVGKSLNANLDGISLLEYKGNPEKETIKKSATSIVNKEN